MGISGLAIQALPKQNSASMNSAENQQRLERLDHQDNWHITYLQLYASTSNLVFNCGHCLNVFSLFVKFIKPHLLWFAVHASKIYQDFCIFLNWQLRSYIGNQRKGFFGESRSGGFFPKKQLNKKKVMCHWPKEEARHSYTAWGTGQTRRLSCISFQRQAFWKTNHFSLRQKRNSLFWSMWRANS